jgi:hypothetical protein
LCSEELIIIGISARRRRRINTRKTSRWKTIIVVDGKMPLHYDR